MLVNGTLDAIIFLHAFGKKHAVMAVPEIRVVFVGSANVGKSSIVRHLRGMLFDTESESTIGAAYVCMNAYQDANGTVRIVRTVPLHEKTLARLVIWDTAGQERYAQLLPMYVRNATLVVGVYDGIESAAALENILKLVNQYSPKSKVMILRNKCDLPNVFSCPMDDRARRVSAKTGMGLMTSFTGFVKEYIDNYVPEPVMANASLHLNPGKATSWWTWSCAI